MSTRFRYEPVGHSSPGYKVGIGEVIPGEVVEATDPVQEQILRGDPEFEAVPGAPEPPPPPAEEHGLPPTHDPEPAHPLSAHGGHHPAHHQS